jgi:hypothetical protein
MQDAANSDQSGVDWTVDEKAPGPQHGSLWTSGPFTTATKMPSADIESKFRASETARANWVRCNVDQGGDDQALVTQSRHAAESFLWPDQTSDQIRISRMSVSALAVRR